MFVFPQFACSNHISWHTNIPDWYSIKKKHSSVLLTLRSSLNDGTTIHGKEAKEKSLSYLMEDRDGLLPLPCQSQQD